MSLIEPRLCAAPATAPLFRPGLALPAGALLGVAIGLGLVLTLVRAFAMLGPPAYRGLFLIHCIPMALLPWLLLNKDGRQQVGLKRSRRPREYPLAIALGLLASAAAFLLGMALFGPTPDHWFVSVANSFRVQPTAGMPLVAVFLMFTIPALIFSPIGEEIFFRGYLQRMLETRFSQRSSTMIEAAWFAGAHLVHHGIVLTAAGLGFRAFSGTLWFVLMFALSWMLAWLRTRHDSIYPAILAHAAFNLGMNSFIFAFLWQR
ncbi:CPBP family intramembrane metalloprotease [Massilia sp. PAMC28688]|uniref:CPBP family intramembrane glutamic endopeptidase n=1 Tax=Massilia sp. PAMC28688 TaxID=2861283 RepID=UPI001C6275C7|nr:CPBP family intramembrane glutamic endopeptidase [Massilia sp. PAMC28688]QYF95233.1 CPBP family intramembrane metalloprotease [Massilia sp. PAMC28688]